MSDIRPVAGYYVFKDRQDLPLPGIFARHVARGSLALNYSLKPQPLYRCHDNSMAVLLCHSGRAT